MYASMSLWMCFYNTVRVCSLSGQPFIMHYSFVCSFRPIWIKRAVVMYYCCTTHCDGSLWTKIMSFYEQHIINCHKLCLCVCVTLKGFWTNLVNIAVPAQHKNQASIKWWKIFPDELLISQYSHRQMFYTILPILPMCCISLNAHISLLSEQNLVSAEW